MIDPGPGPGPLASDADRLIGGPGTDLVTYRLRGQAVVASIGDGPSDGVPLEGDDVTADVERLAGTRATTRSPVARAPTNSNRDSAATTRSTAPAATTG